MLYYVVAVSRCCCREAKKMVACKSYCLQVMYRLLPGQDREVGEKFALSPRDGAAVLSLVAPLDYETKRLYEVIIEARDRAGSGEVNTAHSIVIVKVIYTMYCNHRKRLNK